MQVSTDKAVRPTNVMGTTTRLAELIYQALSSIQSPTRFCMVRFGNVLGSSGSVIPLFRRQIAELARQMVRLSGLEVKDEANPRGDIEIVYTGRRPGEKLFEELLIGDKAPASPARSVPEPQSDSATEALFKSVAWSLAKRPHYRYSESRCAILE